MLYYDGVEKIVDVYFDGIPIEEYEKKGKTEKIPEGHTRKEKARGRDEG